MPATDARTDAAQSTGPAAPPPLATIPPPATIPPLRLARILVAAAFATAGFVLAVWWLIAAFALF
jgi:hypothetical protein